MFTHTLPELMMYCRFGDLLWTNCGMNLRCRLQPHGVAEGEEWLRSELAESRETRDDLGWLDPTRANCGWAGKTSSYDVTLDEEEVAESKTLILKHLLLLLMFICYFLEGQTTEWLWDRLDQLDDLPSLRLPDPPHPVATVAKYPVAAEGDTTAPC
ncbi:hypothetical protein llap_16418 [Limosa lapponica baueri]|uniref:Uncharacterized protein n=1 Tax=Limosa lapponica baueri TaxID=1758121 RepID=A0A2I0THK3_LIMLA|nr:hypothetical protein llap_16418 [Limosa lapponica baueri]